MRTIKCDGCGHIHNVGDFVSEMQCMCGSKLNLNATMKSGNIDKIKMQVRGANHDKGDNIN